MFTKPRSTALALSLALSLLTPLAAQAAASIAAQVNDVAKAENSIQTSTGRIFVSANGYLYELRNTGGVWAKTAVPASYPTDETDKELDTTKKTQCYYLGLTEYANTLYAVCTRKAEAAASKYLMGLDLSAAGAALQRVHTITNVELPNGLASDGQGNLFFANTTLPLSQKMGNIQRLQLSDRFTVAGPAAVMSITPADHAFTKLNPNGMKFNGGHLYVTANPAGTGTSLLMRFPVSSAGTLGTPFKVYSSTTFLDDFGLVGGGMLIAEYLGGRILFINEAGGLLRSYSSPFSLPTSATPLRAGTSPGNAVLVTAGNRVVFLQTDWPFSPR